MRSPSAWTPSGLHGSSDGARLLLRCCHHSPSPRRPCQLAAHAGGAAQWLPPAALQHAETALAPSCCSSPNRSSLINKMQRWSTPLLLLPLPMPPTTCRRRLCSMRRPLLRSRPRRSRFPLCRRRRRLPRTKQRPSARCAWMRPVRRRSCPAATAKPAWRVPSTCCAAVRARGALSATCGLRRPFASFSDDAATARTICEAAHARCRPKPSVGLTGRCGLFSRLRRGQCV